MARPLKNNCDYFSHDADMRNHRKIKAIRQKFHIQGYAIWCMLLEYLTNAEGNKFEYSDIEFELISGDFGVSATEISQLVDYCIFLKLLSLENGLVRSESLDERLSSVYEKREKNKSKSGKQSRDSGKFTSNNTVDTVVSVAETPQSKVNKSKVNNTLVPRMISVFKKYCPDYFSLDTSDPPACLKIAYSIADMNNWERQSVTNGKMDDVILEWENISLFVSTDNHYAKLSIDDLARKWGGVIQAYKHSLKIKPPTQSAKNQNKNNYV